MPSVLSKYSEDNCNQTDLSVLQLLCKRGAHKASEHGGTSGADPVLMKEKLGLAVHWAYANTMDIVSFCGGFSAKSDHRGMLAHYEFRCVPDENMVCRPKGRSLVPLKDCFELLTRQLGFTIQDATTFLTSVCKMPRDDVPLGQFIVFLTYGDVPPCFLPEYKGDVDSWSDNHGHGFMVLWLPKLFVETVDPELLASAQRNLQANNDQSAGTSMGIYVPSSTCDLPSCDVKINLKRCGTCRVAKYCCRAHQHAHWLEHSQVCAEPDALRSKLVERWNDSQTETCIQNMCKDSGLLLDCEASAKLRAQSFSELKRFVEDNWKNIEEAAIANRSYFPTKHRSRRRRAEKLREAMKDPRSLLLEIILGRNTEGIMNIQIISATDKREMQTMLMNEALDSQHRAYLKRIIGHLSPLDPSKDFLVKVNGPPDMDEWIVRPGSYPEGSFTTPSAALLESVDFSPSTSKLKSIQSDTNRATQPLSYLLNDRDRSLARGIHFQGLDECIPGS